MTSSQSSIATAYREPAGDKMTDIEFSEAGKLKAISVIECPKILIVIVGFCKSV